MTEESPLPVTFKISPLQKDWALAEQERIRLSERAKVSQAELFERMKRSYLNWLETERPGGALGRNMSIPESGVKTDTRSGDYIPRTDALALGHEDATDITGSTGESESVRDFNRKIAELERAARRLADELAKLGSASE